MPQDAFIWNSSCPRTGGRKWIFWDDIVIPVKQYFLLIIPSPLFLQNMLATLGTPKTQLPGKQSSRGFFSLWTSFNMVLCAFIVQPIVRQHPTGLFFWRSSICIIKVINGFVYIAWHWKNARNWPSEDAICVHNRWEFYRASVWWEKIDLMNEQACVKEPSYKICLWTLLY